MSSWSLFPGGQPRGFGEDCRGVDGPQRSHVRLLSWLHRCKLKHHWPPTNDSSKITKMIISSSSSNLKFVLGVCSLIFPCWRTCISAKQEKCDKNMKCWKYISFLSYGCLLYRYFFIENGLRHAKCQMIYPYEVAHIATISLPGFVEIDLKVFLSRIKCSQLYTYEMVAKV